MKVNAPSMATDTVATDTVASPFGLNNEAAYQRWREWKLRDYPASAEDLLVEVNDPKCLTDSERAALLRSCIKANMVIYASKLGDLADKDVPRKLASGYGLRRMDPNMLSDDDGITSLQVVAGKFQRGYIPYSNKRLLWHTDGYYNPPQRQIRAMVLHCVRPAASGGENALLDHEMAYLLMRDENPDYIEALMQADAMTIPANTESGQETRQAQVGPVFSVDATSGALHMRYTARTRSIVWKSDAVTQAAVSRLQALLNGESPYIFRHRLSSGQGVLCNNVLHSRTAFEDEETGTRRRLLYRARYYDRIAGTQLHEIFS